MTLVERLRGPKMARDHSELQWMAEEAANEIERLQAERDAALSASAPSKLDTALCLLSSLSICSLLTQCGGTKSTRT
jgi:hypothetical protein